VRNAWALVYFVQTLHKRGRSCAAEEMCALLRNDEFYVGPYGAVGIEYFAVMVDVRELGYVGQISLALKRTSCRRE
jgi:hypothetical protein